MKRLNFADKYEKNANYQLNQLNKAIYRYGGLVNNKARLYKYVSSKRQYEIMQPRTLKFLGDKITKQLSKKISANYEGKYSMFTLVTGFNFGKDNWNMNYDKLKKRTQKLLKGYSYIATIALDEFPKARFMDEGVLMSWHVHGIFFKEPSRWFKGKINQKISPAGYFITPLVFRHYDRLIDAVYYAFKSPFGGKIRYRDRKNIKTSKNTSISLKSLYNTLVHLKGVKRQDFMFAGGKGKKILKRILEDLNNERA